MATDAALFALRAALAAVFVAHGVKHYRNRAKVMSWTASVGFRRPGVQWCFMTFAEIGAGLAFLAGLLTPVAAAAVVGIAVVAFWTVHRKAGFFVTARPDEGWEYVFVLAVAALALAILGPGGWSLDARLGWVDTWSGATGGLIAGSGILASSLQMALFFRAPK
jgi:putative oxidoreductase